MNRSTDPRVNERRLRLTADLETVLRPDGTRLLKQTQRTEYMSLSPTRQRILDQFDGTKTVREVLGELLMQPPHPRIRGFYITVLSALERGILVDAEEAAPEADAGQRALRAVKWRLGWKFAPALGSFLLGAAMTVGALNSSKPSLPLTLPEWLLVLVFVLLIVSLANLGSACVLHGFRRQVYGLEVRWVLGLPVLVLDRRDAFMGGRLCQAAVALQALAVPLLVLGLSFLFLFNEGVLAAVVTALWFSSPFGNSPAHALLHAVFKRDYDVPRCHAGTLNRHLIMCLLRLGRCFEEGKYLALYCVYVLLWLAGLIRAVKALVLQHWEALMRDLFFGASFGTQLFAFIIALVLVCLLFAPLVYQIWLLVANAYALAAPYWFKAERGVMRKRSGGDTPTPDDIVTFLDSSMLFAGLPPDCRRNLATQMVFVQVRPDTTIIRQGDIGEVLFVIYEGKVEVSREDSTANPRVVATLEQGDAFGEIALLDKVPRTATVRSVDHVSLLVLDRDAFDSVLLARLGAERVRVIIQISSFLTHIPLFADWPDRALLAVAQDFSMVAYAEGDVILHQDEVNQAFYVVYEGECEISRNGRRRALITAGEFFGEISLLRACPTVAEVVASTSCHCLRMNGDRFMAFITQDVLTAVLVEQAMEKRKPRGWNP